MKRIGVFCSASDKIDEKYFDAATQIGQWIGETGRTLVYGGSSFGLMECIAQAVKNTGGSIVGVVPTKLEKDEMPSTLPDRIIHTKNLSDRKDIMTEESDILIALPGGVGTLDELFHVMAAASLDYHQKQVVLYNQNDFYAPLLIVFNELEKNDFVRHSLTDHYSVANTIEELKVIIECAE